ncbi:18798_t:CDS:1, partial [Dentiscutata erythropus]
ETEIEQRITDSYNFEAESYSDISNSKHYDPMHQTSAERSTNERFTPLKIRCLGANCINTAAFDRHHANCGGNFQISNRARLKCNGCSLVEDITNFSFNCSNHNGNYFQSTNQIDISAFKRALFSALSEGAMDESITLELIQYLNNGL